MTIVSSGAIRPSASSGAVRLFAEGEDDYRAFAAVNRLVYPEYPWSAEEVRHEDASWDATRFFKRRLLLEADGDVVGWAQVNHARWAFVPDTYWMDLGVAPAARRRGHGSALYAEVLRALKERGGTRVRAQTKESMADGVEFLLHRGFQEEKRDWESRLPVQDFDLARFAGARERVERQGIRITTLAAEIARDPDASRKAWELSMDVHHDVPSSDPPTDVDLETWEKGHLGGPNALLDACFIAVDADGRYLGLSDLQRAPEDPTFLWQGLTGVRREARGKGVAMALKLETLRYARDRGVDHIKTWNDQRNRAMLRINEALGFVKQPAWIQFRKDL